MIGMQTEVNDNKKIMEEFRDLLPKVPIANRGQAVAIYNLMKNYIKLDDESDNACTANLKIFTDSQEAITTKCDEIIQGERKVDEHELEVVKEYLDEGEHDQVEALNEAKVIEGYWGKCIKNCHGIHLEENDEKILESLKCINTHEKIDEENKHKKQIDIEFVFNPNDYLEDEKIGISMKYENEEPIECKSEKINWKEGKDPRVKKTEKKQKNKKTGKTRTKTVEEKTESFFNFFADFGQDDLDMEAMEDEDFSGGMFNLWAVSDLVEELTDLGAFSLEFYLNCRPEEDDEDDEEEPEEIEEEDEEEPDSPDQHARRKGSKNKHKGKKAPRKKSSHGPNSPGKSPGKKDQGGEPKQEECKQN